MRKLKETVSQVSRLMDEWDVEKNREAGLDPDKLGSQSNKYAFWKCKCGYSWSAKISNRYHGRGCPCCARKNYHRLWCFMEPLRGCIGDVQKGIAILQR